eukprot:354028-Chlamydomonas_euryale.AAC.5
MERSAAVTRCRPGQLLPLLMVALLAASLLSGAAGQAPTEVIELTDATFEHDTQAATGQTTGVWCDRVGEAEGKESGTAWGIQHGACCSTG